MIDCSDVKAALLADLNPFHPGFSDHLAQCPACSALLADDAALGRLLAAAQDPHEQVPEGNLATAVAHDIARDDAGLVGRLRALSTGQRLALTFAGAMLPVFVMAIDSPKLFSPGRVLTLFYAFVVFAASASLLAPLSRPRRPVRQRILAWLGLGVPVLLFSWFGRASAPPAYPTWGCVMIATLASAPAFVLLHLLSRRPSSSLSELGLLGTITGLSANMTLQLYCSDHRVHHLLIGHTLIGWVWMACSWLLLRRLANPV
jgi:hypothetical protein